MIQTYMYICIRTGDAPATSQFKVLEGRIITAEGPVTASAAIKLLINEL